MRKPPRYCIIVTGSRRWTDANAIERRLAGYPQGTIVLHGAAEGADTIAHRVATELGYVPVPHPYFGDLEGHGGPRRNWLLVQLGRTYRDAGGYEVVVEAFPLPDCTGTLDCMKKAEEAGLLVLRGEPP